MTTPTSLPIEQIETIVNSYTDKLGKRIKNMIDLHSEKLMNDVEKRLDKFKDELEKNLSDFIEYTEYNLTDELVHNYLDYEAETEEEEEEMPPIKCPACLLPSGRNRGCQVCYFTGIIDNPITSD
jgi:hypothetical protein